MHKILFYSTIESIPNLNEFSQIDELHDDGFDPHDVVEEDLPLELLHRVQVLLLLWVQRSNCSPERTPDLGSN